MNASSLCTMAATDRCASAASHRHSSQCRHNCRPLGCPKSAIEAAGPRKLQYRPLALTSVLGPHGHLMHRSMPQVAAQVLGVAGRSRRWWPGVVAHLVAHTKSRRRRRRRRRRHAVVCHQGLAARVLHCQRHPAAPTSCGTVSHPTLAADNTLPPALLHPWWSHGRHMRHPHAALVSPV